MARPGPNRNVVQFPRRGSGFKGEVNANIGLMDVMYAQGALARLRNYHLTGRGRALKRRGDIAYVAGTVNGTAAIQGIRMYQWGSVKKLLVLSGGSLFRLAGSTWDDVSGGLDYASGQDNRLRTTMFRDGDGNWMIGTDGTNRIWKIKDSGNAILLNDQPASGGPSTAIDVSEFRGRLWALNTNNGSTILEWSDDGLITSWNNGGSYTHCSRRSPGVGLSRHGEKALLIFHQKSIHAASYDYQAADPFTFQPIDETVGCISTHSIGYKRGVTYFAGRDGFYRIRDPFRPAEYIGFPEEVNWASLNESRRGQIEFVAREEPWNEVCWLASTGSQTENDIAFVWNHELEAWSTFDSSAGYMKFNCGCNFQDDLGRDITLMGTYDGKIRAAWGDNNYDTGNWDAGSESGAPVQSEFYTGMLDFGDMGLKRTREVWIMAGAEEEDKVFTLELVGLGETAIVQKEVTIPVTGDKFDENFVFDESRFASTDLPTQGRFKISIRNRAFQTKLTEQNTGKPHIIHSLIFWFQPRGQRFNP